MTGKETFARGSKGFSVTTYAPKTKSPLAPLFPRGELSGIPLKVPL
jgi:hypothetical protein